MVWLNRRVPPARARSPPACVLRPSCAMLQSTWKQAMTYGPAHALYRFRQQTEAVYRFHQQNPSRTWKLAMRMSYTQFAPLHFWLPSSP